MQAESSVIKSLRTLLPLKPGTDRLSGKYTKILQDIYKIREESVLNFVL